MALHSELPIYKVAYDLCDLAVDLVRNMPRDVKGVIGGELRDQIAPLVMVGVVNSTPEPDGTRKRYFLRVPPDMKTARAAVAWTFGIEPTEYKPTIET